MENKKPEYRYTVQVKEIDHLLPIEGINEIELTLTQRNERLLYAGRSLFRLLWYWWYYRSNKNIKFVYKPYFSVYLIEENHKTIETDVVEVKPGRYVVNAYHNMPEHEALDFKNLEDLFKD